MPSTIKIPFRYRIKFFSRLGLAAALLSIYEAREQARKFKVTSREEDFFLYTSDSLIVRTAVTGMTLREYAIEDNPDNVY